MKGADGPAVVGANWFQFRPGQRIRIPRVDNVSYIWAVHGSGEIRTSRAAFRIASGDLLRVPWRTSIEYRADARTPFRTGSVHLVPWHAGDVDVDPRVAGEGDDLFDVAWRRGPADEEPARLLPSRSTAGQSAMLLATYCVERFLAAPMTDEVSRALGVLVAEATAAWLHDTEPEARPTRLNRMIDHVARNLDRPLGVAEVAHVGGCSTATAQRLFRRWTGQSVLAWISSRRMQQAARLLRTTGLGVAEVGRAVGFDDPLYFSRAFSRSFGVPPRRYADGSVP